MPRVAFSTSSPVRLTRPRVSRVKVFSSRSSASEPETSSTVTKSRVIAAATATAKVSSGGTLPAITSLFDGDRLADRREQAVREREVLPREAGEVAHLRHLRALRRRQARLDLVEDLLEPSAARGCGPSG